MDKLKEIGILILIILFLLFTGGYIQQYNIVGKDYQTKCLFNFNNNPNLK